MVEWLLVAPGPLLEVGEACCEWRSEVPALRQEGDPSTGLTSSLRAWKLCRCSEKDLSVHPDDDLLIFGRA